MMDPVVWYSAATSGVAASTEVLDIGARNEQNERRATTMSLRWLGNLSYTSSGISTVESRFSIGASGPIEWCVEHRPR